MLSVLSTSRNDKWANERILHKAIPNIEEMEEVNKYFSSFLKEVAEGRKILKIPTPSGSPFKKGQNTYTY